MRNRSLLGTIKFSSFFRSRPGRSDVAAGWAWKSDDTTFAGNQAKPVLADCYPKFVLVLFAAATLTVGDPAVIFDRQNEGFPVTMAYLTGQRGGRYLMSFSGFVEDDERGSTTLWTTSPDRGRTWTPPTPFGQELAYTLVRAPENEALFLMLFGSPRRPTVFSIGYHLASGARKDDKAQYQEDLRWRASTAVIGRLARGASRFDYQQFPSGTFLGEQFPAPGLMLPSGRIVAQIWGARSRGENWRAGVLLSDDDGRTWRYRDVAYEPEHSIRNDPRTPAGYNEQTLFQTRSGRLVSIIRGREGLGRVPSSPRDTFYSRAVSADGGETWSMAELTDAAGTGAPSSGITLPDGSLLFASRVPYSRTLYPLPAKDHFGLIFFRSRNEGKTWTPERVIQADPEGRPFDGHYNAMNGQFVETGRNRWIYTFAQFDVKRKIHRLLYVPVSVHR